MEENKKKLGILHDSYKTEYKDGFATYKCGQFHDGIMLITGNRKEIRKHIMQVHYGYR
jgi:hypothetical protein